MGLGKQNKTMQIIILVAIVLLGGFAVVSTVFKQSAVLEVGSSIPDLSLQQLDGGRVKLSDFQGKGLVLQFWGSWCSACKQEMPVLQQAADKWQAKEVEVVGINGGEEPIVVKNFMKKVHVHFIMLLDQKKKAFESFGIGPLPTTVFVRPDGKIYDIVKRVLTPSQLDTYIQGIQG